jgi:hypothetical protein
MAYLIEEMAGPGLESRRVPDFFSEDCLWIFTSFSAYFLDARKSREFRCLPAMLSHAWVCTGGHNDNALTFWQARRAFSATLPLPYTWVTSRVPHRRRNAHRSLVSLATAQRARMLVHRVMRRHVASST